MQGRCRPRGSLTDYSQALVRGSEVGTRCNEDAGNILVMTRSDLNI